MTDPLREAPPGLEWTPLSPNYERMKHLLVLGVWGTWGILVAIVCGIWAPMWAVGLTVVVFAAWIVYRYRRIRRMVAAWGYAEGPTELFIRRGLLMRSLTVVPYGRMQVVEVESGPIERHFGLTTVRLVTASAETDAEVPGLADAAAASLRDRITEKGENQAGGL